MSETVDTSRQVGEKPSPEASWIRLVRNTGAPYLSALLLTVVVSQFAQYLWPTTAIFKGQNPGVVIDFVGFGIAVLLWWCYRPNDSWPPEFAWLIGAWAALWAVTIGLSVFHGDLFNVTAILVLPTLAMIWLKKPSLPAIFTAGDLFAVCLIAIAVASQLLDLVEIKALHYEGWNRWPLLTEITGPIGRWEGPFGNVNYAGPVGVFLLIFGLLRPTWRRAFFVVTGAVIIIISDSRSAVLSCAVGIAVLIAVTPRLGHLLTPTWLKIAAPTAVAVAFTGYIVAIDPTLNLRTPVWETFLSQWMASPITGVGGTGIQAAINDGFLQAWANHGHSLVIDPMARYGVIGLLAVAAVLATTGIIATKAASAGFAAPAVLLAAFIAAGVSDTLVDWRYLGVQAVPNILAALLGAALLTQKRIEAPLRRP